MDLFTDEKASSIKAIKLLLKHKALIIIFTAIGLGIGITATFFQPKKYIAFAVVFPPNSNSGLNILEDPRFGNSLDADQLMQLLESQMLKDSIIQLYKLDEYYKIDKSKVSWQQTLNDFYFKDISFKKTRYYSIEILVKMKNSILAANIANSIVEIVDVLRFNILRQSQLSMFTYVQEQFIKQQTVVDSLKKQIYVIKESIKPQNLLYNHLLEYTKTDFHNSSPFVDSPEMEILIENYNFELEKLKGLKVDYHKAQRLIEKPFSKVFVINKAIASNKKISPSLKLNAFMSLISSFLFIILFLIIRDRFTLFFKLLKK